MHTPLQSSKRKADSRAHCRVQSSFSAWRWPRRRRPWVPVEAVPELGVEQALEAAERVLDAAEQVRG